MDISKNSNIAKVHCALDIGFFYKWLSFTTPLHKLTKSERQVLASFLSKRHELSQIIRDENMLDNVLNSVDIRKEIREAIGLTTPQFNILISKMRRSGVMDGKKINKHYIPNIQKDTGQYRLTIIFDINDKYKVEKTVLKQGDTGDGKEGVNQTEPSSPDSGNGLL